MTIGTLTTPNPYFLAPLAGYTDAPFRRIAHEWGSGCAVTEMVSAEGLARDGKNTLHLLRRYEGEDNLIIQIFAPDRDPVGRCLDTLLSYRPSMIDLNCGCPVNKVVRTGAGSALMKDPGRIHSIVSFLCANAPCPVSVKFRLGWDSASENYLEVADACIDAGASMLTLHARTRGQMYSGKADWDKIRILKDHVRGQNAAVFASGDIFCGADALEVMARTGCDGVMFARGAIGNPFIFRQTELAAKGIDWSADAGVRISTLIRHLDYMIEDSGEAKAVREMRKHAMGYFKGLEGASKAKAAINSAMTRDDYLRALEAVESAASAVR